jgi:hypothetical protein
MRILYGVIGACNWVQSSRVTGIVKNIMRYLFTLIVKMYSESWILFCESVDSFRECVQVVLCVKVVIVIASYKTP